MNVKNVVKLALPLSVALILAACNSDDRTVATVGDVDIKESELNTMLQKQYGTTMLDTLVSYKIVDAEAKKQDVTVSEEAIDEEYAAYAEQYGGEEGLQEMFGQYNMSEQDIREDIRIYLLTIELLKPQVEITDEEIIQYYEDNKVMFATNDTVTASQILVDDEQLAQTIIERIQAGEDFVTLAKEFSIDDDVAETGGSLGTFGPGEIIEDLEEAAFTQEVGTVSEQPIQSEYGFHILYVEDRQQGEAATFEDVQAEVKQILLEQKIDEIYPTWLEQKYEQYDVEQMLFEKE